MAMLLDGDIYLVTEAWSELESASVHKLLFLFEQIHVI